jgi:hypothetical protein
MEGLTFSAPLPFLRSPRPLLHLVVLVAAVLAHPIGIQHLHVRMPLPSALLRDALDALRHSDLGNAHSLRSSTPSNCGLSPSPSADARPSHNNPRFRLVAQGTSTVEPGGSLQPRDGGASSPFDHAGSQEGADIGLTGRFPRLTDASIKAPVCSRSPFLALSRHLLRTYCGSVAASFYPS